MKWELKTLDELGFVGRGKSRHRPRNAAHLYGGIYPLIQTGDIQRANFYINDYIQTYSDEGLAQSKLWKAGTMVISIVGANTAETAILGFDACFPDSVIGFVPKEGEIDVKFVKYSLENFKLHLKSISEGTARENLSLEKLLSIRFPVPSYDVQKKIASILSAYDKLIENNLKRMKLLEEKALIEYNVAVNSEDFELKRFSDVADYINGYPFKPSEWNTNGWPIIKIRELKEGIKTDTPRNDGQEIPSKYYIDDQDILFAWSASIGVYLWSSGKGILNQHIFNVKPFDNNFHNWLYFSLLKKIPDFISLSNGATMQHIKKSALSMVYLPVPPIETYKSFQAKTDPILALIVNLDQQNTKLREARDILLPRLMNETIPV